MESGKAQILGFVAKMGDRKFRGSDIVTQTGLSRQLVHHHLTVMTEKGWLERDGRFYLMNDLTAIIDELTNSSTDNGDKAPQAAGFANEETAKVLSGLVRMIVHLKTIKAGPSYDMAIHMNRQIDDTVKFFKTLKRYLNNYQPAESTSLRDSEEAMDKVFYDLMKNYHYPWGMTHEEWQEQLEELRDAVAIRRAEEANA